tara:strand:+ start:272 stop:952 length:681 start_codon:yes stop_codon:yes gene_type:complete
MTSYPKEHNNIILLTQQGGCGAHFIISLASFYFNSCNNQSWWETILIDKFNGYVGIQCAFEYKTSLKLNLTDIIHNNVDNNDYIFKGLKLQEWLDPSLFSIQQCHVSVKELNQSQLGPSNKVIRVFTEDNETMVYCQQLDTVKNGQREHKTIHREYIGANTQPSNNIDLFDFNYNEIILKSNYKEFTNFANWLEVEPMPKHIFKFRTNHYNKKNKETLDYYWKSVL